MKLNYNWTLKDAKFTKDKGKVFSCFACGGGSTMGYKLAGFDVIGCNEIDPKMMDCYKANHNPKYAYLEPIQTFKDRDDLPEELYNLDILDGSPPCSSFSMAGNREKDWGKEKKFREGQSEQVLDTLFFDFIELAKKLQPRVVIAENVKGMLLGDAQQYVDKILTAFNEAGYHVTYTLLNASKMGVPQRRERVFFTAIRKDIYKGDFADLFQTEPVIDLSFNQPVVNFKHIATGNGKPVNERVSNLLEQRLPGENCLAQTQERVYGKRKYFNTMINQADAPSYTITASCQIVYDGRYLCSEECIKCGSFPSDYDFVKSKPEYLIGMSVPPLMTAGVADRVLNQWLNNS